MERVETKYDIAGTKVEWLRVNFGDLPVFLGEHKLAAITVIPSRSGDAVRIEWAKQLNEEITTGELEVNEAPASEAHKQVVGVSLSDIEEVRSLSTISQRDRFVYFIQCARSGLIKIGTSANPEARVAQLSNYSASNLKLLKAVPGDYALEREFHRRFQAIRNHREWFNPEPELIEFISQLVAAS